MSLNPKLGIIAGNGRLPLLVLDAARAQGYEVVVAAIKEVRGSHPCKEREDGALSVVVGLLSIGYPPQA